MSLADGSSNTEIFKTSTEPFVGITVAQLTESPMLYGSYSNSMPLGQLFYDDTYSTAAPAVSEEADATESSTETTCDPTFDNSCFPTDPEGFFNREDQMVVDVWSK